MSRGSGHIERRIGELFAGTKDRALSVADICDTAFALGGTTASRAQRLSATRAAHRLLRGAATARSEAEEILGKVISEAGAILGRPPGGRGREAVYFHARGRFFAVDEKYADAMAKTPSWPAWQAAWRKLDHWPKAAFDWRGTRLQNPWGSDGALVFHPADYPVRLWAADLAPEGVLWAEAEITKVAEYRVHFRYHGAAGHLDRRHLSRSWALWRNVYFTSERTGALAQYLELRWFARYHSRPGSAVPPQMQMRLAEAMELLGVPTNFTREDIIAGFRRMAKKTHPDLGGSAELFRKLVEARDRLLAALGTTAAAPKMPEFAPKGVRLRYRTYRPSYRAHLGYTRRLTG